MSKLKNNNYNPSEIEKKWQRVWKKSKIYSPDLDKAQKPFYNLMMFPYPSAEGMHVGNMYAFTGADVYGRFQRMHGQDVFEPIGLDGFGIHSENYAIRTGRHPASQAKISEKNYYQQLRAIGGSFDWTRTVETYKLEYYKWTQWLFIQLFKAGLAYRKKAPVNFCPSCKTVLADEQVEDGKCERCGSVVEKRDLEQWFFKITKYADRLLNGLSRIDWAEKVKIAQRQWIGRSEGMIINFGGIDVFTTRPETADGATFLVLSPQHPIVASLQNSKLMEIKDYIEKTKKKTGLPADLSAEAFAKVEERAKDGVFSGKCVTNPLTKKKIPIWISDYILMDYGTGAIMAVPAEDEKDREFAEKYKIPIVETSFSAKPIGKKVVNYHLRDWLISRQRYWGPPIPMIYCQSCAGEGRSWFSEMAGWYPEENLPVELPFIQNYKPLGTGKSPLASHPEFYKTKCPKCGGEAKRETDVSDTFLDSSWYFLRYLATDRGDVPFPSEAFSEHSENSVSQNVSPSADGSDNQKFRSTKSSEFSGIEKRSRWLPVSMYIGGAEHSVLHLLYSRFITMVLKDLGFINFEEPFTKFRAHGLIVKDGAKMSKSRGNVVVSDSYIKKFGADTLRTYLMFMGPFSQGGDFRDTGIEGMHRFLKRVWNLISEYSENSANQKIGQSDVSDNQRHRSTERSESSEHMMHKTIKKVTEDIENLSYNTAIAALMEYYNFLAKQKIVSGEELRVLTKLIAPFMPHMAEEIWEKLGENFSVHKEEWPKVSGVALIPHEVTIVAQINGKKRDILKITMRTSKHQKIIEQLARGSAKIKKYLDGGEVKKVIYVEGKIINFVTG